MPCTIGSSAYSVSAITAGSRPMPWMPQPGSAVGQARPAARSAGRTARSTAPSGSRSAARTAAAQGAGCAPQARPAAGRSSSDGSQRGRDDLQMAPARGVEDFLPVGVLLQQRQLRRARRDTSSANSGNHSAAWTRHAPPGGSCRRCSASATASQLSTTRTQKPPPSEIRAIGDSCVDWRAASRRPATPGRSAAATAAAATSVSTAREGRMNAAAANAKAGSHQGHARSVQQIGQRHASARHAGGSAPRVRKASPNTAASATTTQGQQHAVAHEPAVAGRVHRRQCRHWRRAHLIRPLAFR